MGAGGRFALDDLPFTGAMTTYGLKVGPGPDYPIAYVSDSAPTASAWSTGHKTVDARVSQGPSTAANVPGNDYETVLEKYAEAGQAHRQRHHLRDHRRDSGRRRRAHQRPRAARARPTWPTARRPARPNGGRGSIAEQLVDNEIDVLMGGGATATPRPPTPARGC